MTLTARVAAVAAAVLVLAACGSAAEPAAPAVRIDLPAGGEAQVLAVADGGVLVGVRRDKRPGLLRRAPDGTVTELPVRPSTGYGASATWYALTGDGDRVLGIGGDNGGAETSSDSRFGGATIWGPGWSA